MLPLDRLYLKKSKVGNNFLASQKFNQRHNSLDAE